MPLLTEANVRATARVTRDRLYKSHNQALDEAVRTDSNSFDIFLSHSIKDAEIVHGVHVTLKQLGYSVYVDWIVDKDLDREAVSRATAMHLKKRMRQCSALLYLSTENAVRSKWMPWELGFFDAYSDGRVAILPITKDERNDFSGQEYLGLYPYVDVAPAEKTQRQTLWVNRSPTYYGQFGRWLKDGSKAITKRG